MKLIYRVAIRAFIILTAILSVWAFIFYFIIINEVNDEVDDNLEDYSEIIIAKFNTGDSLPDRDNGTNNSYHIELISSSYIEIKQNAIFLDEMIYIEAKSEAEPARILKTIFTADNGKTYRLVVYTPSIEHEDLIESILYSIIYLFILLLISIVIITIWIYKTSMSPMYKILKWLKDYKLGAKNIPLDDSTDIVEFKKLNDAIKSSIIRIEKSYTAQKEFIGNASHEMQTPLAICQTRLEALLETDLKEEQLGEILKTQQTIDYMRKLNRTLLLLAQIENQQFIEKEEVDFNIIIQHLVADLKEVYTSQQMKVEIISNATLIVNINSILAKTLIINLIKNAFFHNIPAGNIRIQIDHSRLVVENSGDNTLNTNHVFERFYQAKKKPHSTGLGLAIVSSICKENNFEIKYKYIDNKHQFSIVF